MTRILAVGWSCLILAAAIPALATDAALILATILAQVVAVAVLVLAAIILPTMARDVLTTPAADPDVWWDDVPPPLHGEVLPC